MSDSFSISYLSFGNLCIEYVKELTRSKSVFQAVGRRYQGLGRLDESEWYESGSVEVGLTYNTTKSQRTDPIVHSILVQH